MGILGTIGAFAGKYIFDYRLAKRRLELDERAAITTVLGNGPGQLRRSALRLTDRVDGFFRDQDRLRRWLLAEDEPQHDRYFLTSSVQRVFAFVAWGAALQQNLDALPPETLAARRDLRRQYALIELCGEVLTDTKVLLDLPGYVTEREGFHLFTGTVDELADLGTVARHEHGGTIPNEAFADAYGRDRALLALRTWLGAAGQAGSGEPRGIVVMARLACLGAVADMIVRPDLEEPFVDGTVLRTRLEQLESGLAYPLSQVLPAWMDSQLAQSRNRWTE
ncbi:hypothetical protein [Demequina subtropica]|uniref:hypothetical protein n=1 Tax=Demequina subtropica TaxID=1638989 RepID=UPI0012E049C8|nr:hypothetical protein [Demequina subtropica]